MNVNFIETLIHDVTNESTIKPRIGANKSDIINSEAQIISRPWDSRKPIWRINHFYHCSTIGTCLTLAEQRKILAKEKIPHKQYRLYEIHGMMISMAKSENSISRRTNNLLNQKYREEILEFSDCNEREFLSIWDEKLEVGDICGLYWVAVSNKHYSEGMLNRLFGDVHMLSHINGGEIRGSLQEALRIKKESTVLKKNLKEEKETRRKIMKKLSVVEKEFTAMESKYRDAMIQNEELTEKLTGMCSRERIEQLETDNSALKDLLKIREEKLKRYEKSVVSLKDEKERIQSELSNLRETTTFLKNEFHNTLQQFFDIYQQCDESCPVFDLCEKRILIVGGITKMRALYRDLIEEKGGIFDYHDGYMRAGENALEEKVKRSDVVLCPVDVNSHNACLSVKKICKKIDKPYWMLSNSSLTSITQSLMQLVVQSVRTEAIMEEN
jgi:hypothetical protein